MKRVLLSLGLIVLIVGIAVAGCAKPAPAPSPAPTPAPAPTKTLDIGIDGALSGPVGNVGTNYKNAVLMAMDDQNNQGGVTIAGQKYMLNAVIRDNKFDLVLAKSIAEEYVFDKGIKVIMGPTTMEGTGIQMITEKNKVIMCAMSPVPWLCSANKPYSYFFGGYPPKMYVLGASYIQKFYPEEKTVFSVNPDVADAMVYMGGAETMCKRYGLNWLGYEKYPYNMTNFMPLISRVLAKKPDIVDTGGSGGYMGQVCVVLVKQLREAGFKGIIYLPTVPPPGLMETLPKDYLTRIVTNDIALDGSVVTQAYKDLINAYAERFREAPIDLFPEVYNTARAFFKFLDGQDSMDTITWVDGFAKYRWQGIWGHEDFVAGKPVFGINRFCLNSSWASEWKDGKLYTDWIAPMPYELFVEQ